MIAALEIVDPLSPCNPIPSPRTRKKPGGDPRRALPHARYERDGDKMRIRFPIAESAGASPDQILQATIETELGLLGHGKRQAHCGVLARPLLCVEDSSHRFRRHFGCGNRYCVFCGRRNYNRLFARHSRLFPYVENLLVQHPEWLVAKLDFTVRNNGRMPDAEEIRKFNQDVRTFFKELERRGLVSKRGFGAIGCNEFGGSGSTSLPGHGSFRGNTNLHAHYAYVGPKLPQSKQRKELSAIWSEIRGERAFVSIKRARSFVAGLAHALKYAGKFLSSEPRRLAQLEQAFFRVRRVHTFSLFFNPKIDNPKRENTGGPDKCPNCGGLLGETNSGWLPVPLLEKQGYRELSSARLLANRSKALVAPTPP